MTVEEILASPRKKYKVRVPSEGKARWNMNRTNKRFNTDLEMLLLAQGNACAICSSQFTEDSNPHIDHDHDCCSETGRSCGKCIRGLTCRSCNLMLGHANDSHDRLLAAATYLMTGGNRS